MPGERVVGDRLVLEREAERAACGSCPCSRTPRGRRRPAARARAASSSSSMSKSRVERRRGSRCCLSVSSFRPVSRRWVGKIEQARVLERARAASARSGGRPRRRPRPRTRARSRSGGGRRRSAARRRRARPGARRSGPGRPTRQSVLRVPSSSVTVGERLLAGHLRRASRARAPLGSGNRLKMGERLARVARVRLEPVLLRPGMGALVRADAARRRSPPRARARRTPVRVRRAAVGGGVVLAQHPDGGLVLLDQHARLRASSASVCGRALVALAAGRARRRCSGLRRRQLGPHARRRSRRREGRSGRSSGPATEVS